MEKWKDVIGYEGYYQVSNLGRVRSVDRIVRHSKNSTMKQKGRILSLTPRGKCNHLLATLHKDGHRWTASVHRLVLASFVGPCPEGKECLHGPAGVADNSVSNLKWGTSSENHYDMHRRDCTHNGVPVVCSDGREFINMAIAAEESGCNYNNIWKCCNGRRKTTGGYSWKYKE